MTNPISDALVLLPELKRELATLDYKSQHLAQIRLQTIIAAVEAMKPTAAGTHVMVPKEPTEEMSVAGFIAWKSTCFRSDVSQGDDIYRAMLAALAAIGGK